MIRPLPPPPFGRSLLLRSLGVWLTLHLALGVNAAAAGEPPLPAIAGTAVTTVWLTAVTVAAVWLDMRRRRELLFLNNLGYSSGGLAGVVAGECVLLDVALRLGLG